jgi:hypothetical protein
MIGLHGPIMPAHSSFLFRFKALHNRLRYPDEKLLLLTVRHIADGIAGRIDGLEGTRRRIVEQARREDDRNDGLPNEQQRAVFRSHPIY